MTWRGRRMPRRRQKADGAEEESVTVSSIPGEIRSAVKALARRKAAKGARVWERDIYIEALKSLFRDVERGVEVTWLATSRVEGRLMVWLPVEVSERFRTLAAAERRDLTVVFLTALRRYLET